MLENFPYTDLHNLNLDWIIKKLKDLSDKLDNVENDNVYIFKHLYDFKQSNTVDSDVVFICDNNGSCSLWLKSSKDADNLTTIYVNGNNYTVFASDYLNVLSVCDNDKNLNANVSKMIAKGYNKLFFPEGTYTLSLDITVQTDIKGAGITKTTFVSQNNSYILHYIPNGTALNNSSLADIYFKASLDGVTGIFVESPGSNDNMFDWCSFKNLKFQDCSYAINCKSRMIYNYFENIDIYGCYDFGMVLNGAPVKSDVNTNTFINCHFSHCRQYGIYITAGSPAENYGASGNCFIGCCIENNGYTYGNKVSSSNAVVYIGSACNVEFVGCYFENNKGSDDVHYIVDINSGSLTTFSDCTFTLEKNKFIVNSGAKLSVCGCTIVSDTGGNLVIGSGTVGILNSDFTGINSLTNPKFTNY